MKRVWAVKLTIVEDWEAIAAIAVRRYEVLAESPEDAEIVITEYLIREYACALHPTPFRLSEIIIDPMLFDVNAIRDGLMPVVRCLDD